MSHHARGTAPLTAYPETIYDVADAAGPLVAGLPVGAWGYAAMFRTMAIAATLTGLMFYWLSRPAAR